jgi:hypothetical protein
MVGGDVHTKFWWGNLREELFGRNRHMWDYNIQIDLQEMRWSKYIDLIVLAEDRDKW